MIRILAVLLLVAGAAVYWSISGDKAAPPAPEVMYKRQADKAEALEQQLQQQARDQLESIDEQTR
jgi:hypothetical protein